MPRTKKPPAAKLKPRLTDRERGRIGGLHEAGVSARDIALVTERSRDTVARAPPLARSTKTPRPSPALTHRETRRPVREASKGELSAAKLKAELQLSISTRTIARVDWLVYTKMVNTLPLKPEDMLARQAWASAMLVR
ncbi:hypothetical protein PI124_g19244 [Phytophthora idaei]|nr:hypothetical protein PI125_g19373 [Phytophthora idaei]KAG3235729.1 hypothetical protein PI124_g19244 [Phytophthora idaei]